MRVIFPPITIRLMVNVKALVFKNRLKKKKKKPKISRQYQNTCADSERKIFTHQQKRNLQNLQPELLPLPTPASALQMRWAGWVDMIVHVPVSPL